MKTDLRAVQAGEVPDNAPSYRDALILLEKTRRALDAERLRCTDLERQLHDVQDKEAGAPEVREVLKHCKTVLGLRSKIVPGSDGWKKVKARLRDFDVVELKAVPEGAKRDRWHMAARHRLQPKFMFRSVESVEELRDLGMDFEPKILRNGLTLTKGQEERLARVAPIHFFALDECDCGHLRLEHGYSSPPHGWQKCLHSGCECFDFDDIDRRADLWLVEERKRLGRSAA